MPSKILTALCLLYLSSVFTPISAKKINTDHITIVRDRWGVPYIYAPSDEEVAYGFAWAAAEDDFQSIQENLLAVRQRLGEIKGKEGVILDFISHLIAAKEIVDTTYEKQLSPQFRALLSVFSQGINDYAAAHPEEVLLDGLFPVSPKDQIRGYMLSLTLMTNVQFEFERIFTGNIQKYLPQTQGSNGFAISRRRTTDGKKPTSPPIRISPWRALFPGTKLIWKARRAGRFTVRAFPVRRLCLSEQMTAWAGRIQ